MRWSDERSYDFCFEGLPEKSTVAVSTNDCIQSREDRYYFKKGLQKLIERLSPHTIINYSYTPDDIFGPYRNTEIEIIQIPNWNETVRERGLI